MERMNSSLKELQDMEDYYNENIRRADEQAGNDFHCTIGYSKGYSVLPPMQAPDGDPVDIGWTGVPHLLF